MVRQGISAAEEEMLVQKVIAINPGIDAKDWTRLVRETTRAAAAGRLRSHRPPRV